MKCELLAPVGDFRSLRAAVDAGADAVYFGIKGFNMRDAARNFELKDLKKIRKICGGVKMYLTLNVVVYDGELARVEKIVKGVKNYIDAIICWDFGVIELCRKHKVPFHVSTQASVSNLSAARFYKNLGAKRVVLARELSLKQIKKIAKIIDVECFCHGAMCVAVSGRCFMSQFSYGLSANRGQCAQLCRRSWDLIDDDGKRLKLENSRVMSAKDLCALPFIEEMKRAGVKAFKIEGRNRSPEYVSVVVGEYRKALDARCKMSDVRIQEAVERLKRVYNRGFSSGFYFGVPTADDFSWSENGEQSERKEFVGKVYKFWPKVGACSVKMSAGRLKVGDEVYLIGDDVGAERVVVKSIELDGKGIGVAKKGQDVGVDFGVKVGRGCEVYLILRK
ncbi:MAG: U32 family peptidase [archaeon]